jgi:peptidoglycan-associated lipoprotein
MSRLSQTKAIKLGALLIAMTLFVFASGCKKKVPPPPPPPPAEKPVEAPPPPAKAVINSFTVEPSSIEKGQAATLRWNVSNATDMSIDQGIGAVQSQGQRQVFPSDTTTYTLSAKGPGGADSKSVTVSVTTPPPPPAPPPPAPTLSSVDILARDVKDVYFDYDKSELREDGRATLTSDAEALKKLLAADSAFIVSVEGHCDERGSAEYNLALGDRRATAAREFLVQLGVPGDRLKTISYGKEKPQCTDANEECYQKNRRAHFSAGQ